MEKIGVMIESSSDILKGGHVIIASFKLEELSEEREIFITSSHSGCSSKSSRDGAEPQDEVDNRSSLFPSSLCRDGNCQNGRFPFRRAAWLSDVNGGRITAPHFRLREKEAKKRKKKKKKMVFEA